MKFNLNSIIAIIVVLAFLGSMIAMAFNPNAPQENNTQPIEEQPIAQLQYTANIKATTYMLSNLYRVYAITNNGNITEIDNELIEKLNLKKINSYFDIGQQTELGQGIRYIANIVPEDTENIYEKLEEIENFEQIEFLGRIGTVEIPEKITAENTDLNITKELEIEKTLVDCILENDTIEDSEIDAMLVILTEGNQQLSVQCIEVSNPLDNLEQITEEVELTEIKKIEFVKTSLLSDFITQAEEYTDNLTDFEVKAELDIQDLDFEYTEISKDTETGKMIITSLPKNLEDIEHTELELERRLILEEIPEKTDNIQIEAKVKRENNKEIECTINSHSLGEKFNVNLLISGSSVFTCYE